MFKLTVIICVYNEELCLLKALRSLYQNNIYEQTEVIIIDDCSTNPITLRQLSLLEKHTRYSVIYSQENKGLSNSRNLGFEHATTPYVLPLDADDLFPSQALDSIYDTFVANQNLDFIIGNYYLSDDQSNEMTVVDCSSIITDGAVDIKKLAIDWKLLGTSPCKKTLWERVGGYDLKYSYSIQDVDFWIRALLADSKGGYLNLPIYIWNRSVTGMNMNFDRLEMIKLMEDHRSFYLLNYTESALSNRIFEAYYPYKQKEVLFNLGKKHFFLLKTINQLRLIVFYILKLFSVTKTS